MKRKDIDPELAGRLAETLRQHGPLAGLDADAAVSLIRLGTLVELEPGEVLIREDEEAAPEIYLLVEGALVVKSTSGTVARLNRPGDVVGEVAVLLSSRRTADVIADSAVRALAISAKTLELPEYAEVASAVGGAMLRDDWIKY
jgi:CRP-like cAMP-binding protein